MSSSSPLLSLVFLLLSIDATTSRLCTQADNCNLAVALCTDPALRNTCTYQFGGTNSFADQNAALNACKTKFGAASTPVTPGDTSVNMAAFNLCNSHRFFDMRRRAGALCNQWETLAGVPISFLNFDNGEPSNGGVQCTQRGAVENCVGFKFQNGNSRWHDSGCTPTGGSTTFVAQCVVCDVPPPPTTTTTTTTSTVQVTTTPTTSFFVDFTTTTTTTNNDGGSTTLPITTAPTTPKPINIGADTGVKTASTTGGGSGDIKSGDTAATGGLSDAALGGLIAGILCCCLCLILLIALFVRRRGEKEQELKVIVEATPHMEPRYAPPHDADVGQYGPTPVSPTYKQFPHADAGASWNGGPPPPVLMMGAAGGGNMNSARQYGSPDHTNTLVGGSGGMQTFQDYNADARQMPPAAYFPSSGANDLPSLPPLPPYPQGLNNQWGDIQQQYGQQQQQFLPQYAVDPQQQQHYGAEQQWSQPTSEQQWSQPSSEQFDSASLRKRDEQQSLYGASNLFQSVRETSQQEEYGTLNLQQPLTSTYGLR
jgi:hypothetical protein